MIEHNELYNPLRTALLMANVEYGQNNDDKRIKLDLLLETIQCHIDANLKEGIDDNGLNDRKYFLWRAQVYINLKSVLLGEL